MDTSGVSEGAQIGWVLTLLGGQRLLQELDAGKYQDEEEETDSV